MDAPSCIAIVAAAGAVASPTMVPVVKPIGAPRSTATGQSIEWFAKDIIAVGRYEHRDGVIEVDEAMLDTFVKAFEQMTAAGVDVEFTLDHSDSAADVLGFIRALYRVGDRLWGTFEVRGWDAVDCVGRNRNVSAEVSQDFVDGKGNHYGPAIFAVSLVKAPVVAGQAEFVRLGRNRPDKSSEKVPLLVLSRLEPVGGPQVKRREGDTRWFSRQGGTNMTLLATVAAALGLTGLTEDNAATMLGDYAKQQKTAAETAQATLSRLQGELDAAKAKIPATLSRVEMDMIEERADTQAERIDGMVGSTIQVDAGLATVLKDAILGKANARPVALFSRPEGGGKAPVVAVVDSLVKAAKPATLSRAPGGAPAARTPAQPSHAAHLSRVGGGGGDPAGGAPAGQEDVKAGLAGYGAYLGHGFKAPDGIGG